MQPDDAVDPLRNLVVAFAQLRSDGATVVEQGIDRHPLRPADAGRPQLEPALGLERQQVRARRRVDDAGGGEAGAQAPLGGGSERRQDVGDGTAGGPPGGARRFRGRRLRRPRGRAAGSQEQSQCAGEWSSGQSHAPSPFKNPANRSGRTAPAPPSSGDS
jgi:hypothetical protein